MNDIYGNPMPPNPYKKNATMQFLGNQRMAETFWCNEEVRKEIKEISEARPYSFSINAAADIFALGFIHGKRAERQRRK